jgi:hypothetical protein
VPATGFSGGRFEIAHVLKHMDFCLLERQSRYTSCGSSCKIVSGIQIISRTTLFDYSNSRFAQVSSANLYSSEAAF